ncbi:MAG: ATP-binding protein [Bacillota bacterium]|nr:ATP-binding protein [Bacillota bacterium]
MKELSLHILDIVQNSIKAEATEICITIDENPETNILSIVISDNGCGMSEEFLKRVKDPFATTRTTRKVGMGISLFEAATLQCGGHLDIDSKQGVGTKLSAYFEYDSIDRAPIGNMAETMVTLISGAPNINYVYKHRKLEREFVLNTREIRQALGEVPLNTPEILSWISEYITEGLADANI